MAKFCGNCGAELDDSARVCGKCGTPLDGASANISGLKIVDPEKQKKIKRKLKLFVGGIAVILVAIVTVNIASNFTGYKGLLRKVMTAYEGYDIITLESLSSDMYYYGDEDYAESYFRYAIGDDLDYFESSAGHNYKLSYEVQEIYTLSGRKQDTILNTIKSSFPDFDIDSISQIKIADIKVTAKEGKSTVSMSVQVTMTKENGSWKILYLD